MWQFFALFGGYALVSRLRVLSSFCHGRKGRVVIRMIVETYFTRNKTFPEWRKLINSHPQLQRGTPLRITCSQQIREEALKIGTFVLASGT
jgi:hypothetical protein